jgi:hypothetical protein
LCIQLINTFKELRLAGQVRIPVENVFKLFES